ncbi:hypothetical protein DPX16_16576 [Anabarilius grahami]|uniref:Chromo domain-containing protein n=1 Tax=Anabarilius grahami TaxID=495550 RepID=A0A3N0XVG8_ANAGA|nr:hypothetical protein DPX16_16576 [Anabarilius grahami]
MDGLLRICATGCRVDEAFTMDDLVDSISADTSGLRFGHVQLRIVFITPLEDGTAYQVNEILDSQCRGGLLEYLVDWEGYGPEERS